MTTALIITTINVPELLLDYAKDAVAHRRELKIYVAGDRKTPEPAVEFCRSVERETGISCEYLGVSEQELLLRPWPDFAATLPWNSIQRRNVAVLKAAMDGAETVVTVDDDNFIVGSDYFGSHAITGTEVELDSMGQARAGGWFNICRFLRDADQRRFFPRGYGMAARRIADDPAFPQCRERKRVVVNAGLWLGDPDIDGVTRLAAPIDVRSYDGPEHFFVAGGVWTPFNSQNTALARELLPAYFLSPDVGRYDDIFASFVVKRIADHLGHGIAFGAPIVRQDRNEHDLYDDFDQERMGMRLTDVFITALEQASLSADNYADCALELCPQLEEQLRDNPLLSAQDRQALAAFCSAYQLWTQLPLWS